LNQNIEAIASGRAVVAAVAPQVEVKNDEHK
jgi:hypothetical protein